MQNYSFYQQNPAILIFLTKCNFKNSMLWKWKFPIFEKQLSLSIAFPFIDDFTLNIDKINGFLKFWPLMTFFGLHWPFWPLWPWMNFLSKNWPLQIKIKHNWPVSNIQMWKPITKRDSAIWITVYGELPSPYMDSAVHQLPYWGQNYEIKYCPVMKE